MSLEDHSKISEIERLHELFELASENANLGIFYYDLVEHPGFFYAQDKTMELIGAEIKPDKLYTDEVWIEFMKSQNNEALVEHVLEKFEGTWSGKYDIYDVEYPSPSFNPPKWLQAKAKVTKHDETGKPLNMIGMLMDITEQKKNGEILALERDKATAAARAKSEFLATMSHEIRTPMNGVIGMTDLLLATKLDKEQTHFAQTIQFSGRALLTIINDILDFSKIEAGKVELEHSSFAIAEVIEGIIEILAPKAHDAGLEIGYTLAPDLHINVNGDSGRLRQILINLIGNAIKFTSEGGVCIAVDQLSKTNEHVNLRFAVQDTGIGISKRNLEKLFSSFTQVDASTTRLFGGTGLGLAISKGLIKAMGGKIGVESKQGSGSTFWIEIELPISKQTRKFKPEIYAEEFAQKRILLLDNNTVMNDILKVTLEQWKLNVEQAYSYEDALKQAMQSDKPFDLIMSCYQLVNNNGFEFLKWARKQKKYEQIPFILSSFAATDLILKDEIESLSAISLTKPFKHEDLLQNLLNAWNLQKDDAKPNDVQSRTNEQKTSKENGFSLHILVAEDNIINQQVAKGILDKIGHKVDLAANGEEALNAVKEGSYDLIFMDVQMPVMDGLEATKLIRNLEVPSINQIPIIALTANALDGDRERCLEAGMDTYLSKPVTLNKITEAIKLLFPAANKKQQD